VTAKTVFGIVLQLASCGLVALACGDLLLQAAHLIPTRKLSLARREHPSGAPLQVWAGGPERALVALCGFVLFAAALMVLHVTTGGAVFDSLFVVPGIAAVVLFFWVRQRLAPRPPGSRNALLMLLLLATALVLIYALPAFQSGSSVRTGDPPWHLGWTEQILHGDPLPTGPAPEFGRNAYPWGLHSTISTIVRLTPGTDPLIAFETLHLVLIAAIPLAAACLARRIDPRAGWAAAGAVSLIGGFGWLMASEPAFITSPGDSTFGADLVVASPNSVYELFPSANPREIGLVVVACAAALLFMSVQSGEVRAQWLAGAIAGVAGLVSVPMFMTAVVWIIATAIVNRDIRFFGRTMGAALLVFGLWAAPVALEQVRYGGFVNITPRLGKEWPLPTALASWGLLLPLAVGGVVLLVRNRTRENKLLLGLVLGTTLLLLLAIARGRFDWSLAGNATLLHQGRVWPPAHLLAGVLTGIAITYVMARTSYVRLVAIVGAGLLVVGAISPAFASLALTDVMEEGEAGFVYADPDIRDEDRFVQRAAAELGPNDVVRVPGADELAFLLFQFSGARLAVYDDPRVDGNDLRIRYQDPADDWQAKIDSGGFEADYVVIPVGRIARPDIGQPLVTGDYRGETLGLYRPIR
jgi:hypothetical protein